LNKTLVTVAIAFEAELSALEVDMEGFLMGVGYGACNYQYIEGLGN